MTATIIDGKAVATHRADLALKWPRLREKTGRVPELATVLVGENPASQAYVVIPSVRHAPSLASSRLGTSWLASTGQADLEALVRDLNANPGG